MENFNFKRFWNIVKYELLLFRQLYFVWFVVICVVFVCPLLICGYLFKAPFLVGLISLAPLFSIYNLSFYR